MLYSILEIKACGLGSTIQDMEAEWRPNVIKVGLSQKILEIVYVSNMNIPKHYPEQKI